MKLKFRIIPFLYFLSIFIFLQCKSPQEPTLVEMADGSITIRIEAPANVGGKPAYLKLYEQDVNIYDPAVVPLATITDTLDASGNGSATFSYDAIGGEVYQIAGAINVAGAFHLTC
ncbi:hypothetical protein HQ585_01405 [candidate division KSB1 bacterium]|nr:hypothetical protein [candidate division KSB1 bacterium]